ncbi:alpha/beta fold hydrolase [Kribbella sp. NPDC051952]|uniref:alpha/beta fold hydrolase n=1 Tax=Kribbella sp. NPDC051952 TaxID=3154851 RepID=UPI0034349BAD
MGSRRLAAGAHILLAAVHIYWATGATWPASDERSLSRAVLGGEASFAPHVVLPLAALHLLLALAVLRSDRSALARIVVAGLAAGLAARATLGLVWAFTATGTAFFWLNLFLYTPACVALLAMDVRLLQAKWLKRLVIPLPVIGVVLVSLLAYGYQPTAQPNPEPSKDSRYVDTPVARFHYLQRGTGAPVVLLSPGAAPASAWQPELEALSKTHAVYVVDLPGQGETRLHGMGFAFDLDAMTGALGEFLDQLNLQHVVLGGNSWSGGWGLAYAQRHPERVSKLLLLAPSGLAEPDPASWEVLKLPLAGELLAKLGASRTAVQTAVRDLFVHKDLVTPALVDQMWVPGTYRDNVRAMYALERGLDWRVTQAALPSTRQPVLVVWGEEDSVLPVTQAKRFGDLLPHATVRTLPGCGHALTLDCAGRVTPLLEEFLA